MFLRADDPTRIGRILQKAEAQQNGGDGQLVPDRQGQAAQSKVRVSSETAESSRYPGYVLGYDVVNATWTDLVECWVVSPNAVALPLANYNAQYVGAANERAVFMVSDDPVARDISGGTGVVGLPMGCRLSLTDGSAPFADPVDPNTDSLTAQTTIYLRAFNGGRASLFYSAAWHIHGVPDPAATGTTSTTLLSVAVPSTTNTNFDVFLGWTGSALTLTTNSWVSDSAGRNARLDIKDGIFVQPTTLYTYLGTCRTTGTSGKTEDTPARRLVANYYNRVRRHLFIAAPDATWTYGGAMRATNADATIRVDFVQPMDSLGGTLNAGLHDWTVSAMGRLFISNDNAATAFAQSGIGLNSTTVNSAQIYGQGMPATPASPTIVATFLATDSFYKGRPIGGYNYLQLLEAGPAGTNFKGQGTFAMGGILGEVWV